MSEKLKEIINVEISRDRMLGVVWFNEPKEGGERLQQHEIEKAIKDKGIVSGINQPLINEITTNRKYDYKYIVAMGTAPVDGEDGSLSFAFDEKGINNFIPKEKEDGTVDFKDLNSVYNVNKGTVLVRKTLPTPGKNGTNILGQIIKAKKGKDVRIPKGKNTEILEDNVTLVAAVDGKLEYDGHNAYINTVYTLHGDLDSGVGNIKFVGNVVINGNVLSGFTIEAGGSVEVRGSVENAIIIAGGDIILSYGIQGTERSKLIAGGNIIAKFIQNTHVEAKGDIITEAILHSTSTAGNSIIAELGKGTIVGGSAAATCIISARSIGSPMGTVTSVQIGVTPEVYQEHKRLGIELKNKEDDLKKMEQAITFLTLKAQESRLDASKRAILVKLKDSKEPLVEEIHKIKKEYSLLSTQLSDVSEGIIRVSDVIYPGVKITIGSIISYMDERRTRCTIRKEDGDIRIS